MISSACWKVGALESGFKVEPWPTRRRAVFLLSVTFLNWTLRQSSSNGIRFVRFAPFFGAPFAPSALWSLAIYDVGCCKQRPPGILVPSGLYKIGGECRRQIFWGLQELPAAPEAPTAVWTFEKAAPKAQKE